MRSGNPELEDYPVKGRFKQSLIAGSKPGDTANEKKLGTFKAKKIEFFGLDKKGIEDEKVWNDKLI